MAPIGGTTFNVTTPGVHPNFAIPTPPARTGIRPTGAYWGAGGEQIDMLSGNLNWTQPLLKAQGRSGWSAGFNLNYNSQLWRQDSGGTWNLGMDVGYGYGCKRSAAMDFGDADEADDQELNDILWKAIRGTAAPPPVRSHFARPAR